MDTDRPTESMTEFLALTSLSLTNNLDPRAFGEYVLTFLAPISCTLIFLFVIG